MRKSRASKYVSALAEMKKQKPNLLAAFEMLESAHSEGDPNATYAIGTWYLHGKPPAVERNTKKGTDLIREAADAGVANACFDCAVSLEKGISAEKNSRAAFLYFLKAALLGDQNAFEEVGRHYYYGIGVEKDRAIADVWLWKRDLTKRGSKTVSKQK
jgi:uncharacterized protein